MRKVLYLVVAGFFFVLGAAGAILPGLPATPFLLLTSYFLLRSSPRMNQRLLNTRLLGPILRDWQQNGGVRLHVKIQAVVVIVLIVGLTVWLSPLPNPVKIGIALLALVGICVVLRLPRADTSPPAE